MASLKIVASATEETKHSADMESIILHGDKVYSAADDGKLKVWSKDLSLDRELQAHDYAIYHLMVFNDKLMTASIDSTVKVWQLPGFELVKTLTDHEEPVRRIANNGERIFTGDEKGDVIVYDGQTLEKQNRYETVEEVWDMAVQGRLFYTVRDRGMSVTEVKEDATNMYTVVKSLQCRAPIYLSKQYLAVCEFGTGLRVQLHKNEPNEFPKITDFDAHSMIITCLAGNTVGGSERLVTGAYDNTVKVWSLPDCKLLSSTSVPVTPSVVTMATDGTVYVGGADGYLAKLAA